MKMTNAGILGVLDMHLWCLSVEGEGDQEHYDDMVRVRAAVAELIKRDEWMDIAGAPKGNGDVVRWVNDPMYIEPPRILLLFPTGVVSVAYWDWYYDETGNGYQGYPAWIEPVSGELLAMHYDAPIGWKQLPPPTNSTDIKGGKDGE